MYMLDTNILIFCMRHHDSSCATTFVEHTGKDLCISAVTYAELEYGIENSSDPERNRRSVNGILAGVRILDFDINAATQFGRILAEQKKKGKGGNYKDRDKMIAAHARSEGYTLVTENVNDFQDIDRLIIENWREPGDLTH